MLVPHELGGDQVDLQTFLDVVELLARGNGAVAWDVATSSFGALTALTLPTDGVAHIYASGPDVIWAGTVPPSGRAVVSDGGYRYTGRWRFGSGCAEADWMLGGSHVYEGGSPRRSTNDQPEARFACFPRAEVTIHEGWDVVGLRGTGSHDFSVTDLFVPESLTQRNFTPSPWSGTLYRLPAVTVLNAVHFSAVATGIARRAIDALVELAKTKTPTRSQGLLRERVQVQEAVARAEVLVESARAYRAAIVADVWTTAEAGKPIDVQQRARMRLAGTSATENAVRAVDLMFSAGGTTAIEDASPLSHCFRDVHVVAQNINVLPTFFEHAGRVLLDLDSGTPAIG
jgi:alkylation response protein AidB-like acyl-CoA dehydrogenase